MQVHGRLGGADSVEVCIWGQGRSSRMFQSCANAPLDVQAWLWRDGSTVHANVLRAAIDSLKIKPHRINTVHADEGLGADAIPRQHMAAEPDKHVRNSYCPAPNAVQ